jgi:UDP-GlcNAc:undecaprenyl-phosphate GlcNAc-1-phosphate transferase
MFMLFVGLAIFVTSLLLASYSTGKIIYISHKKNLFDEPLEKRKIHLTRTPNLGGVAIFASTMFTSCLLVPTDQITHLNFLIACATIIFIVGLVDDLVGMDPMKKMLAQLIVALIATIFTDFRITGLNGLFGINELPYALSLMLSIFFILLVINAFNLIDGINWLAGSVALLVFVCFAFAFQLMQLYSYMFLSVALCGSLCAFLYFNRTPAKIFMGDTGSLFVGLTIALFSIRFLESSGSGKTSPDYTAISPALLAAFLIIPVFDTARIFFLRVKNKKSPFSADKNHIHHRLIALGFSHMRATGILICVNISLILFVILLQHLSAETLICSVAVIALILNQLLEMAIRKRNAVSAGTPGYEPAITVTTRYFSRDQGEAYPSYTKEAAELSTQD